jgi:hypothetical protein
MAMLVFAPVAAGQTGIADDDRVVFYGDALVVPPGFSSMVEQFVRVKYPKSQARFWYIPATTMGYAGTAEAAEKFDELVTRLRPTVVVLCVGLGDGHMKHADAIHAERVGREYERLLNRVLTTGAKVFALTPPKPAVSKKAALSGDDYDEAIGKVSEAIAAACAKKSVAVLDWFGASSEMSEKVETSNLTTRNGLTPTPLSESVAARLILDAWKLEPIDVAVKVDWSADTVESSAGKVTLQRINEQTVQLDIRDFPMPWHTGPASWALREEFACSRYSRIMLEIANLPPGRVTLSKSGAGTGTTALPAKQFAKGYNLSFGGPLAQADAVEKLAQAISDKNRAYQMMLQFRRQMSAEPPKIEHLESYRTHLLARYQYHEGSVKIVRRTPRSVELKMDITLQPTPTGE